MSNFEKLGILEEIDKTISELGFDIPTKIQKLSIPKILEGKDVIATSATGSGKTLCFASRLIEAVDTETKEIQGLVITPTRELAKQITNDIKKFSKYKSLGVYSVFGGESIEKQKEELDDAQIIVSTTGRLLDHIERGNLNFENLKVLVLDEADLLLNAEFREDIDKILEYIPNYVQKMMFSATINEDMLKIASRYMNEPEKIKAEFKVDKSKLNQYYYEIDENEKLSLLVHLLKYQKAGLSIIFSNRHEVCEFLEKNINKHTDLEAKSIHGGLTQNKRDKIIVEFRDEGFDVLITSDIAARGLDIANVTHIYNYNLPKDKDKYMHRIGRTARAGESGNIINLISKKDVELFGKIIGDDFKSLIYKRNPDFEKIEIKENNKKRRVVIKKGNKKYYR